MIALWVPLFVLFLFCGAIFIPRETLQKRTKKDWQFYAAHVLFYSIPASYFFSDCVPSAAVLLAAVALFLSGSALHIWAIRSNPYFSPEIVMPPRVIITGAYQWRYLKHPAYTGASAMATGSWLLGAPNWALIPLVTYLLLLAWRARKETLLIYQ